MTMPVLTQVSEPKRQSPNLVGLCSTIPPYSPDLAQSDFHLFGLLKGTLHGTRFEDDENVIRAVRTRLSEQEMSWYRESLHALVSRWRKAVDLDGDYVEK
jgi:histone-lysine N-methyltransferase SETMAR